MSGIESLKNLSKTREEVVQFIKAQFAGLKHLEYSHTEREKNSRHHYGVQELRDLLDYLYGHTPTMDAEKLTSETRKKELAQEILKRVKKDSRS